MPITRLRKTDVPYTILPVDVLNKINNPTALSIWAYLQGKPESWIVRQGELCSHFGIGRDRCRAAIRWLREFGLWTESLEHAEDGKIIGRMVTIHHQPVNNNLTTLLKNRPPGKPSAGKSPPIKEGVIEKKETDTKESSFLQFWREYPKKQAKADARVAWNKMDGHLLLSTILKDLRRRRWPDDKKFIPLPASYLRGRRWEDEDEPAGKERWI